MRRKSGPPKSRRASEDSAGSTASAPFPAVSEFLDEAAATAPTSRLRWGHVECREFVRFPAGGSGIPEDDPVPHWALGMGDAVAIRTDQSDTFTSVQLLPRLRRIPDSEQAPRRSALKPTSRAASAVEGGNAVVLPSPSTPGRLLRSASTSAAAAASHAGHPLSPHASALDDVPHYHGAQHHAATAAPASAVLSPAAPPSPQSRTVIAASLSSPAAAMRPGSASASSSDLRVDTAAGDLAHMANVPTSQLDVSAQPLMPTPKLPGVVHLGSITMFQARKLAGESSSRAKLVASVTRLGRRSGAGRRGLSPAESSMLSMALDSARSVPLFRPLTPEDRRELLMRDGVGLLVLAGDSGSSSDGFAPIATEESLEAENARCATELSAVLASRRASKIGCSCVRLTAADVAKPSAKKLRAALTAIGQPTDGSKHVLQLRLLEFSRMHAGCMSKPAAVVSNTCPEPAALSSATTDTTDSAAMHTDSGETAIAKIADETPSSSVPLPNGDLLPYFDPHEACMTSRHTNAAEPLALARSNAIKLAAWVVEDTTATVLASQQLKTESPRRLPFVASAVTCSPSRAHEDPLCDPHASPQVEPHPLNAEGDDDDAVGEEASSDIGPPAPIAAASPAPAQHSQHSLRPRNVAPPAAAPRDVVAASRGNRKRSLEPLIRAAAAPCPCVEAGTGCHWGACVCCQDCCGNRAFGDPTGSHVDLEADVYRAMVLALLDGRGADDAGDSATNSGGGDDDLSAFYVPPEIVERAWDKLRRVTTLRSGSADPGKTSESTFRAAVDELLAPDPALGKSFAALLRSALTVTGDDEGGSIDGGSVTDGRGDGDTDGSDEQATLPPAARRRANGGRRTQSATNFALDDVDDERLCELDNELSAFGIDIVCLSPATVGALIAGRITARQLADEVARRTGGSASPASGKRRQRPSSLVAQSDEQGSTSVPAKRSGGPSVKRRRGGPANTAPFVSPADNATAMPLSAAVASVSSDAVLAVSEAAAAAAGPKETSDTADSRVATISSSFSIASDNERDEHADFGVGLALDAVDVTRDADTPGPGTRTRDELPPYDVR